MEEGGGRGAESIDRKKALSSKNHFILSEVEDCMEWGGVMYCLVLDRDMQAGSAIPHIQTLSIFNYSIF